MKNYLLTRKEILHLARLANLYLADEEIEKYRRQLSETVNYVKNLSELNTDNVAATNQTTNLENVTFIDGEINERQLSQEEALSGTKQKKNGYFVVKRII